MSPSILIIDDHPEFRDLLAHHINAEWPRSKVENHDHTTLPSVEDLRDEVDVILLDYRLGDENGLDWLRIMRAEEGCPPIIFLTAAGDELLAVRAIKAGAHDYLPKNRLTNEMLINSIRDAIRSRSPLVPATSLPAATLTPVSHDVLRIRGYEIQQQISERGPSLIYLAEHEGMQVALKVLLNAADIDADKLERFLQECEVVTNLRHPNVVRIYDHGVADEVVYIAMEYFPRGDLKANLRKGMSAPTALRYVREITVALDAIHKVGILHRDLKPANVMVREDRTLALIDFGHAKQMWLEAELTDTGEVFGTPYYMSPEQGQGEPIDERSDIYSVGVLFYELLTGRKPYTASSPMAVIYKHTHAAIPQLPRELLKYQPLIARMMAKEPENRFQSAEELLEKLDVTSNIVDTSRV
ncbi:MAG: protein kinase [Gammaproteobacteria bacterium]|nr:protein kinase [Gammaproteobacteria bacterium]NNF62066.1 protein kinase [Gammaproteobacteria bacterium]NNM20677.1 protein kinase [Gammaproteobacteria bacterium]